MRKTFKIFFAFIIIILIFIYISGLYFFRDRFMPRTYINGYDFGLTKISEFEKNYSELSKNFVLDIVAKDKKNNDKITAEEIKFEDNIGGGSIKQTPLYWPVASLVDKKYQLDTNLKYDDVALTERLNNLNPVKNESIHSKDAKVVFDKGEFKVEKEVHGDFVKQAELRRAIISHFADKKEKLNLEKENLYIEPSIIADSQYIKNQLESYKNLFTKKIIFDFDDRKEEVTGQSIIAMYSKSDDGTLVIDENKVAKFVENLAAKYDTFRTSRIFNTTGIGKVKVDGGIYGWLTDRPKTRAEVIAALNKDEVVTIKPIYRQDAVSRTVNDIGNTYIEVDLARQKLWYYNKGNLELETNIVSGNPTLGNGTPTGTDRIWSRERDRFLTGENYRSKVNYWLPINWSGIGLHDATWRSNFGGNIYLSSGSHGCINIPPAVMKNLFDKTFNGMPVIVYNSATQKVPDTIATQEGTQTNQGQVQ
ncbi:L,D-transpeptidase family protein [Peptoniphilus porci]|uniref:L,D-TPase catalytic domain-containing protein n=1 Tax=Peptoniphilus porci TaxID=2652280 RepID=A0A1U7LZB7_9FIRM|nr:L,D-transpeptidase family protein [Peptoniphilus porci]OLR64734.1 hypothetical protein BIV18_03955 [Peptoniphilus porci]